MSRMPEGAAVTDTGKCGVSRISGIGGGKGWRDSGLGGSVIERAVHVRRRVLRMVRLLVAAADDVDFGAGGEGGGRGDGERRVVVAEI